MTDLMRIAEAHLESMVDKEREHIERIMSKRVPAQTWREVFDEVDAEDKR